MEKPDEPRPKKARMSISKVKSMLIMFFDCQGVILKEWVPPGTNVNSVYYREILRKLCERIRKSAHSCGRTVGCSTMTMLQVTQQ